MKTIKLVARLTLILIISVFVSCKEEEANPSCFDGVQNGTETGIDCGGNCQDDFIGGDNAVTDIDGNTYSTVQIGDQYWLQENLKVEHFRNGDEIPTGLTSSVWRSTTSGAFAIYDNIEANQLEYGLLYNWFTVADPRGLCPCGWHVPTIDEWAQMIKVLDPGSCDTCIGTASLVAGGLLKTTGNLADGSGLWLDPNAGATNSIAFSGLPGGHRDYLGNFADLAKNGNF